MNTRETMALGAFIAFCLCGLLATPSGDPLSMFINGTVGGVVTFFLLRWLFSRRATNAWSERFKIIVSLTLSLSVTLIMVLLITVFLLPDNRVLVTTVTLREKQASPTTFHGYYVVEGITNNVQGSLPANFVFSKDVRSIRYEFFCDEKESRDIEMVFAGADGSQSVSLWKNRISGSNLWLQDKNGSYGWRSESTIMDNPFSNNNKNQTGL